MNPNHPSPTGTRVHPRQRIVLLQHGGILGKKGKTGLSLLRFAQGQVVAVIDPETAGQSLQALTGIPLSHDIPIVSTVRETLVHQPDILAIGIAPSGGRLTEIMLEQCRDAARSGISIWNGLHTRLAEDPVIAPLLDSNTWVWDMRQEPAGLQIATAAARNLPCRRVLFVGTDMAIGKMSAAIELDREAKRRGLRSRMLATGQAGMMISGQGFCLDAVRVDFAAGAVEAEVMRQATDHDWLFIEGQGSLLNPASTATLPLIRGSQPTHLILVHKAGMKHLRDFESVPIPPLPRVVDLYEMVASAAGSFPTVQVCGIALNTFGMDEATAQQIIRGTQKETGLPTTDAVRYGAAPLLDVLLAQV